LGCLNASNDASNIPIKKTARLDAEKIKRKGEGRLEEERRVN